LLTVALILVCATFVAGRMTQIFAGDMSSSYKSHVDDGFYGPDHVFTPQRLAVGLQYRAFQDTPSSINLAVDLAKHATIVLAAITKTEMRNHVREDYPMH
jgi:hypothetical protein